MDEAGLEPAAWAFLGTWRKPSSPALEPRSPKDLGFFFILPGNHSS